MKKRMRGCFLLGAMFAMAAGAHAQDVRGSITGRVTDSAGGVLVGATIVVQNVATGVETKVVTNQKGLYQAPYLIPGVYKLSVQFPSFGTAVREKIELRVEDRLEIDVQLQPAGGAETIEVIAEQPLLETRTPTSGQVVDSTTINEMPLGDGTAYFLARLAPGVEFTGEAKFTRPMDNVNLAGLTNAGLARGTASGENNAASPMDFSIDGVGNFASQNRLGFSPPSGAIQEFKVSTAVFDAQFGRSGGGSVSLALKSGTNDFGGEISYYNRDESRAADNFFAARAGEKPDKRDYHRANVTLRGPIRQNRTFFMASAEYLYDDAPEPTFYTVPTAKQREGDFSEFPLVKVYDPFSSKRVGTRIVREAFADNKIPADRIHPIGKKVMSYYPLPNLPGAIDGTRNYYSQRNRPYDYRGGVARVDHVLNDTNRLFLNVFRNWRMEDRLNWAEAEITRALDWRSNTGGVVGWTSMLSASTLLDVRLGFHKFGEWQRATLDLSVADFGFNETFQALTRGYPYFPHFNLDDTYPDIGAQRPGGRYSFDRPFYTYSFLPTLTKSLASHSLKAGYELRLNRENEIDEGFKGGQLNFGVGFTGSGTGQSGAKDQRMLAALLLGTPTGGKFDSEAGRSSEAFYQAAFVQDDWRVTSNLTLNLGLRWEMELGTTERFDRNTRGFDAESPNPLDAAARAKYEAEFNKNPAMYQGLTPGTYLRTPDQLQVKGGFRFADAESRHFWSTPRLNLLPRLGFAYRVTNNMVLRGGWGLFISPYGLSGIDQRGFSRSTSILVTDADGLPRKGVLEDPVPTGLLDPVGRDLGLLTSVGQSVGTRVPYDRETQKYHRLQFGFQYLLPLAVRFEANYVGTRGRDLITAKPLNFLPAEYLIDGRVRNRAAEEWLDTDVPNPFKGLPGLEGESLGRNNFIDRDDFLQPYPHFGNNLAIQEYNGSTRYDSLQLSVNKRFSKGFMLSANYTWARMFDKTTRLNESDPELTERISTSERPHSYKIATVIELPFGKGRRWGKDLNGVLQAVLGGWRLSANYLWQMGAPVSWGNRYYDPTRDPNKEVRSKFGKTKDGKVYGVDIPIYEDTSGFYFWDEKVMSPDPVTGQMVIDPKKQLADDRIKINDDKYKRSFPQTLKHARNTPYHNLDIGLAKTFALGKATLQLRVEALNAENFTEFSGLNSDPTSGSFGKFNNTRNLPRDIQLGAVLRF